MVQRVRDTRNNREVPLRTYERLQSPSAYADEKVLKRILHGLSCEELPGVFGSDTGGIILKCIDGIEAIVRARGSCRS